MAQVSPFTKTVVASMRHLYPETLADKSFDNTGLLLEAPIQTHLPRKNNSVLLTIDLTRAVAEEAIEENHSAIIAYHPIIFRGLKSITLDDSQQQSLLRLTSHGISVYSPHTAVDIVPGGMADWLCDIVTGNVEGNPEPQTFTSDATKEVEHEQSLKHQSEPASETDVTTSEDDEPKTPSDAHSHTEHDHASTDRFAEDPKTPKPKPKRPTAVHRTYSKPSYPSYRGRDNEKDSSPQQTPSPIQSSPTTTFHYDVIPHTRSVITPSPSGAIDAANNAHASSSSSSSSSSSPSTSSKPYTTENTGSGRLITFTTPQPLSSLITRIAHATGTPKGFPVAIPQNRSLESIRIKTVGLCPGSGSSVISKCETPPDLVFTGEMSHHEALGVIERGGCVVCLFHSNSERGYLDGVLRGRLEDEVGRRWGEVRKEGSAEEGMIKEICEDENVGVFVSRWDRDPFGIVVLQESRVEGEKVG
ncbi:hypothetical protein PMZ80_010256 [Knufia obscura]|uniref:Uncharacterized protein n=2 Tax=Knufia TaxID=430999 RepID=A0AAN8EDE2_9EURO|nr:hypothetical protein PMZ80_010256 [Knufia obscura]KAK5952994.1 hypothetical protein OHC33_006115 [Knufia fluminis]